MPNTGEIITQEIEKYGMLQRIKAEAKEEIPYLEYEIKLSEAKLQSLGVNVDGLKLTK